MTDLELDRILTFQWPTVVRVVTAGSSDAWSKGFVRSIAKQGKRPNWKPTPKQAAIMKRFVAELNQSSGEVFEPFED